MAGDDDEDDLSLPELDEDAPARPPDATVAMSAVTAEGIEARIPAAETDPEAPLGDATIPMDAAEVARELARLHSQAPAKRMPPPNATTIPGAVMAEAKPPPPDDLDLSLGLELPAAKPAKPAKPPAARMPEARMPEAKMPAATKAPVRPRDPSPPPGEQAQGPSDASMALAAFAYEPLSVDVMPSKLAPKPSSAPPVPEHRAPASESGLEKTSLKASVLPAPSSGTRTPSARASQAPPPRSSLPPMKPSQPLPAPRIEPKKNVVPVIIAAVLLLIAAGLVTFALLHR